MITGVYRPLQTLVSALGRPAEVTTKSSDSELTVRVVVGNTTHILGLLWAGEGWPGDLDALLSTVSPRWPRQLVVAARYFSPGALEKLADRDANWVDESGRCRIETDSGLLVIREVKTRTTPSQTKTFRWAPSSVDIGELLLTRSADQFSALEAATQVGWSHPQTTSVLRRFTVQGWVEKVGSARGSGAGWRLAQPSALLEEWARELSMKPADRILAHRVMRDPMEFLRGELAPSLTEMMPWAASGLAGLEVMAPFITTVGVLHIYVPGPALHDGTLRQLMRESKLREVNEGARIEFVGGSRSTLSLASKDTALPVVSAPRLYADLRALGGRGEDAAQHVREELLGF